jgi:hypothetical protein
MMKATTERISHKVQGGRKGRLVAAAGTLTAGLMALAAILSGPASAQSVGFYSGSGNAYVSASASQSQWTGTVSVHGLIEDRGECAYFYEQGHNDVAGYGAWQEVGELCNSGSAWYAHSFSFSVSDFFSDSVAIKVCDGAKANCRSEHVWN